MPKPFKFRYVNEIVGGFVLLVVTLLVAGIIVAGHAQRWFERQHKVMVSFPAEGSFGLQKGAEVRILETLVGSVDQITVADDGMMMGRLLVRGNFIHFVRADSKAIVKKKFGLAGDAYIEITKGTGPELPDKAVLPCVKDTELVQIIQDVVQQVKDVTLPAIEQARKAMEEYTGLAADLRNPEGDLAQMIASLNKIVQGLEKGEGPAGTLLRDPAMADQLREITARINESLGEVNKILGDVQQMTRTISGEMNDVPGLILQTRETMNETTKLIEGVERHWLLRGYVRQADLSVRIPPSEAMGTGGERK